VTVSDAVAVLLAPVLVAVADRDGVTVSDAVRLLATVVAAFTVRIRPSSVVVWLTVPL
jgi:hypothetical protein